MWLHLIVSPVVSIQLGLVLKMSTHAEVIIFFLNSGDQLMLEYTLNRGSTIGGRGSKSPPKDFKKEKN